MLIVNGGGELRKMTAFNDMLVGMMEDIRVTQGRKPYVLFLPTASFESKPAINSFVKEFGSRLKCKATCAIWKNAEMDYEHIKEKFLKADMIYIGGGRYDILLRELESSGVGGLIKDAYERGVTIVGNSAGSMLLFERSISDCERMVDPSADYVIMDGYGFIEGLFCPHAEEVSRQNYMQRNRIENVICLKSEEYLTID